MPRTIITSKDVNNIVQEVAKPFVDKAATLNIKESDLNIKEAVSTPVPIPDNYISRLFKYIPSEIVAIYLSIDTIFKSTNITQCILHTLSWIVFLVLLILTPFYLWRVTKVTKTTQLVISTLSFVVWVFALSGPFAFLSWYQPVYGSVLLILFTFLIPIISES